MKNSIGFLKIMSGFVTIIAISFFSLANASGQTTKSKSAFDIAKAKIIIEKQSRALENALRKGDSIGVSKLYTGDALLLPSRIGRNGIIKDVGEMVRDSITDVRLSITNLWGDKDIIVEDATLSVYHVNGNLVSDGNGLLIWKKEDGEWKIFREVWKLKNK